MNRGDELQLILNDATLTGQLAPCAKKVSWPMAQETFY